MGPALGPVLLLPAWAVYPLSPSWRLLGQESLGRVSGCAPLRRGWSQLVLRLRVGGARNALPDLPRAAVVELVWVVWFLFGGEVEEVEGPRVRGQRGLGGRALRVGWAWV